MGIPPTRYTVTLPDQINHEIENNAESQLRNMAERFRIFAQKLAPFNKLPESVVDYEEILIEWLLYVEAFSEINLGLDKNTEQELSDTLGKEVDVPRTTTLTREENYLCAKFVEHTIKDAPDAFEILARIASIGLLTEVVQDFVKPNTPIRKSDLKVYLDGPVAMELLGVSGRAAKKNTTLIIRELQRIGVGVGVFSQSIVEIKDNLTAVLTKPHPIGPTAQALLKKEVLRDYVIRIAADPEKFLKNLDIRISRQTLSHPPDDHEYFTEEQRDMIYSALTFHQESPNARDHDADVTALVMRQRRGHKDPDIFKSKVLLMTKNGLLAQRVRKKCVQMGVLSQASIPPVVHRKVITASIWLRTGFGTKELDVPKRLLMANCERILAIHPSVVDKVKELTKSLDDEEKVRQIDILVNEPRSSQILMDKILGAPSVLNTENIEELIEEMLHPLLEKERKKGNEAIKEEQTKSNKKIQEISNNLIQTQAEKSAIQAQLNKKRNEDTEAITALCKDAERILAKNRRFKKTGSGVLAVIMSALSLPISSVWSYLVFLPSIPLAYLTITGNKWIGTLTTEKHAKKVLSELAEKRGLAGKISYFVIDWDGEHFEIARIQGLSEVDTDMLQPKSELQ